jgi:hypothetical protein
MNSWCYNLVPPSWAVCELYLRVEALQDLNSSAGETNGADLPDTLVSLFWHLNAPSQLACYRSHCLHTGVSICSGSWLNSLSGNSTRLCCSALNLNVFMGVLIKISVAKRAWIIIAVLFYQSAANNCKHGPSKSRTNPECVLSSSF